MRYAMVYGLLAGAIIILTMIAGFELTARDSFMHTVTFGYLLMLVVLTLIFVGVKRYRDIECGGVIRFGRAFLLGLGMTGFAGFVYVLVFEIYLAVTDFRYFDDHVAMARERQAAGGPAEEIARELAMLESVRGNMLLRVGAVFLEILPVGLLVALVSAALLRNPRLLPAARGV